MLEHLTWPPLSLAYRVVKDGVAWLLNKRRALTPQQVIELRQKWKAEFEEHFREWRREGLRTDVIIRDVRRIDSYPDTDDNAKRGASPWFRVGLMDTYHRGVQVGLSWGNLTMDEETGEWRFTNYETDSEHDRFKVILMGFIPYENIAAVDWDGDEYYGFPHIYCYFYPRRREPCERLALCEKRSLDHIEYYSEVADYEKARKLSKKRGKPYFG